MELVKMECSSCSAPLVIKPGMSRVFCNYCGATYYLKRDVTDDRLPQVSANDNPIDVKIIPIPQKEIVYPDVLGIDKAIPVSNYWKNADAHITEVFPTQFDGKRYYEFNQRHKTSIRQDILLLSVVAFLRTDSFKYMTRSYVDYHELYLPTGDEKVIDRYREDADLCKKDLGKFRSVSKVYPRNSDRLAPDRSNEYYSGSLPKFVDLKQCTKITDFISRAVADFHQPFDFEFHDTDEVYPWVEGIKKKLPLGKEKIVKRLWVSVCKMREGTLQITPASLEKYFGKETVDKISRMFTLDAIDGISEFLAEILNFGYDRLSNVAYPHIAVTNEFVQISDKIRTADDSFDPFTCIEDRSPFFMRKYVGPNIYNLPELDKLALCKQNYKYYGMNNTPDDDTRVMLAGCIVAGALEMSNPPMDDHWNIHRLFQKTKYSFKDNYCLIQLVSSFRTEKVYGDWC